MDLFTSHRNLQLPLLFCQTSHPLEAASNSLSHPWVGLYLYAYHPIPLVVRTLIKIREDQAEEAIVITSCWPRTPWYRLLIQMVCDIPLLLPHRWDLLLQFMPDNGVLYHTDLETLQLKA